MRGFTSAFIILATVTACGSQYDANQPNFSRDSVSQDGQNPGAVNEPVYVASVADLSQDPLQMSSKELENLTTAMQDQTGIRSYTYSSAPDLPQKLASCNLGSNVLATQETKALEVRNYNFNVTRLQRSRLSIPGSGAEIVFVNISAEKRIARVDIALTNPKATYCVNVEAGRVINRLQITHACQAKLGLVQIEAGVRARNIAISGTCL